MPGTTPDGRDPETLRAYWLAQWERVGRLEDQRLQFSHFVVAASVVAVGLGAAADSSAWTTAAVSFAVAATNVVALLYSAWSDRWVQMHRDRSDLIVEENWPYIADLRRRAGRPAGRSANLGHTIQTHLALHVLMVLAAVALAAAALFGD